MKLGRVGIIDELENNAGSYKYAGRPAKDKQGSRSSLSVENFFFLLQRMRSAVPCIMQCRLPDTWCFPPFFKETNGKAVRGWLVGQKVK